MARMCLRFRMTLRGGSRVPRKRGASETVIDSDRSLGCIAPVVRQMGALFHALAKSMASDNLRPALVSLTAVVITASLTAAGSHIAEWRRGKRRRAVR